MESRDSSDISNIGAQSPISQPLKKQKNWLEILLFTAIILFSVLWLFILLFQGRVDIQKLSFIKNKPIELVKCPNGDEQCKDHVDGEMCYPGLRCNKSGEACGGGPCIGLGEGKCLAGKCGSEKRYLAEKLGMPEDFMGVFDSQFKGLLENIFSGNIQYSEIDQGIYRFSYTANGYGVYTYLYDEDNSKIEAILGMPEEKVVFDLTEEIRTFNNLTNIPTKVVFHTFYLGAGYENVFAYVKQIGEKNYAIYDTGYEDPRYGGSRVYFTYDKDTKQLIYIRFNFSREDRKNSARFLEKFEEEVLAL